MKDGYRFVICACLLVACGPWVANANKQPSVTPPPPQMFPTIQITEQAARPVPTPLICTSLSPGMSLSVTSTSCTSVQVEINGLKPGEKLLFIAHAESDGYSSQIEIYPVQEVGADGRMVAQIQSMGPLPRSTKNQWEIQVAHSRGVACAQVTLP